MKGDFDEISYLNSKFLHIIETNAFALEEPTHEMQKKILSIAERCNYNASSFHIEKRQTGAALYINVSRFNHSCDPNVVFVFDNQCQKIVLCTARFIKKGEELTISYGPIYHTNKV